MRFIFALVLLFGLNGCAHISADRAAVMHVDGMVCVECVGVLESNLRAQPAVADAKADLPASQVVVHFKPGQNMDDAQLRALVKKSGYVATDIARR